MKTAFISDIHSNLPALEKVLEVLQKHKPDIIYCLGDLVGYHSSPNEVIELIRSSHVVCLQGNHDKDISERGDEFPEESIQAWTYRRLTQENIQYLRGLPPQLNPRQDGIRLHLVHGSPASVSEYMFEGETNSNKFMEEFPGDILMAGHTHYPFIQSFGSRYLVNTGSVGRPKIGRPESSYIILETSENSIDSLTLHFTPYDYRRAMEDMKRNNLSEKVTRELELGRVL